MRMLPLRLKVLSVFSLCESYLLVAWIGQFPVLVEDTVYEVYGVYVLSVSFHLIVQVRPSRTLAAAVAGDPAVSYDVPCLHVVVN